jgi:hypothetical protein
MLYDFAGLPVELSSLADAALPLALPPPGSISPSLLDNSKLDKLVATLGRYVTGHAPSALQHDLSMIWPPCSGRSPAT